MCYGMATERKINSMKKTIIIAEAGVNHNGDINKAIKLINSAANSGADIIKFQTFQASLIASNNTPKAPYQIKNTDSSETQEAMLKKLELNINEHHILIDHCKSIGIEFLSSAFDLESIDLLSSFDLLRTKIPSGEITNLPYLRKIASLKKPIILSTGMATLAEVESAIFILEEEGIRRDLITVMHCSTDYPASFEDVNLKAIETIRNAFKVNVGYSDHTLGIVIPIAAVALGAQIIEKHITLNKNLPGPDHRASLEPDEFEKMVESIRTLESSLGNGIKMPSGSEKENIPIVRKSLVASCRIKVGDVFDFDNLSVKRPGSGISPMRFDEFIGRRSTRNYTKDQLIEE